ncbi:hypothetical protein SFRURICE_003422 [Spodoptera frugiperda]|nr:hypothetical protein SFRURICE_003422 [Spodoptera frugiperda]
MPKLTKREHTAGKCATSTALASPPRSLLGSERRAEKRPSVARAMCSPPLPEPISGSPALSRSLLQVIVTPTLSPPSGGLSPVPRVHHGEVFWHRTPT